MCNAVACPLRQATQQKHEGPEPPARILCTPMQCESSVFYPNAMPVLACGARLSWHVAHAILQSEDAPALETTLHRRFVDKQVNKLNKRKEFFRVNLKELREAVQELDIDCEWTLEYQASQYRETVALEEAMTSNAELRAVWIEEQATLDPDLDELEEAEQDLEEAEV